MYSDPKIPAGLLSIMLLVSCSIKESREDCPSYLGLDLTRVETSILDSMGYETLDIHIYDESSSSCVNQSFKLSALPETVWLPVKKGEAGFMVLCGKGSEYVGKQGLTIPEGEECPIIHGYGRSYVASEETHTDTVILRRHSCVMDVKFVNRGDYEVEVEGGVCGFDVTMNPIEGLFLCSASTGGGDNLKICLPRQLDSSLMMRVSAGGKISSYFRLGEYLQRCGYDWDAPDLEDFTLTVNYTPSVITFQLEKDVKRYSLDVAI